MSHGRCIEFLRYQHSQYGSANPWRSLPAVPNSVVDKGVPSMEELQYAAAWNAYGRVLRSLALLEDHKTALKAFLPTHARFGSVNKTWS
jgi:hypothetical protein